MTVHYTALPTDIVRAYQRGAPDAYGNPPEHQVADDGGFQCRHCLTIIPPGEGMLLIAHRPFDGLDAYAETGPIFVCARECEGFGSQPQVPETLRASPDYLLRAYGTNHRIIYGTGQVVPAADLATRAQELLGDAAVAYLHVRSSRNNCYQARIDRG